jgi:hypothetical protein
VSELGHNVVGHRPLASSRDRASAIHFRVPAHIRARCAAVGWLCVRCSISDSVQQRRAAAGDGAAAPEQLTQRVHGVTVRLRQVVGIDCATTVVYDVREATGSAVLAQTFVARLRTRPLRGRTAYSFDCAGTLIVELPHDVTEAHAFATDSTGQQEEAAAVQPTTSGLPLAFGRRLRAEPDTRLFLLMWPRALAPGDSRVELVFNQPIARPFRQKALLAATISCGRSRYLQPILPTVTSMARVPAFTITPSPGGAAVQIPRIAGGIGSQASARRTLSCSR